MCPIDEVQVLDRDSRGHVEVLRTIQFAGSIRRIVMMGTRLIATLTSSAIAIHSFTGASLFTHSAAGGEMMNAPMPLATCHFSSTLAFAASDKCVQLVNFQNELSIVPVLPVPMEAHRNPITAIALSPEGSLYATCSERGTLIRVWRASDGSPVSEVRNSSTASVIRQLCFIGTSHVFCVSSEKVKVFFAQGKPPETQAWEDKSKALAGNVQSYLRSLSVLSTYFASQWSMCECSIPQTFLPSCLAAPEYAGPPGSATSTKSTCLITSVTSADSVDDATGSMADRKSVV